jgi:predicted HicB family RNase H-like nuclease
MISYRYLERSGIMLVAMPIRIKKELKQWLVEYAKEEELSQNQVIAKALREFKERNKK